MIRRFVHVVVSASVMLGVAATPTLAAAPGETTISFDLSATTCSQLPSGMVIHGTGTARFSVTPNGNVHSVVSGTATDNAGGFWRFNYSQNMHPLGGGGVEVTDHFNLVGSGSPVKLHSHFVIDFTSSDLEHADLLTIKQVHGDPVRCDPI
jgi:hypothetical protein